MLDWILRRDQGYFFEDADAAATQQIGDHGMGEPGGIVFHANRLCRLIDLDPGLLGDILDTYGFSLIEG